MGEVLEKYIKEFLEIDRQAVQFVIEKRMMMKEYPGIEEPERVYHEVYDFQFQSYMSLVDLRILALESYELGENEKKSIDKILTDAVIKYQDSLNKGLNIAVSGKRV